MTRTPLTRRAARLFVPAALNLAAVHFLAPFLSALLARTANPEAAIGGYAIALGVVSLVALPQLRIQQLTLVFLEDRSSFTRLNRFAAVCAVAVAGAAAVVALTPLLDVVLDTVFTATGALREQARQALIALVAFPPLAVARTHLHGAALRAGQARLVWAGTLSGVLGVVAAGSLLLLSGAATGSLVAAVALVAGAALEFAVLAVLAGRALPGHLPRATATSGDKPYRAMLVFFAPLLFAAFLPAVTPAVVNAGLTRTATPELSIAAVAVAFAVYQITVLPIWGIQPTLLALLGQGADPRRLLRLANLVGALTLAPTLLMAFVPPLSDAILGGLIGVHGELREQVVLVLRIMAPLPPILAQEQIYTSALMRARRTRPVAYVNVWRLLVLLSFMLAALNLTDLPGAAIGGGAWAVTLSVESAAAYLYGRGTLRTLTARWKSAQASPAEAPLSLEETFA